MSDGFSQRQFYDSDKALIPEMPGVGWTLHNVPAPHSQLRHAHHESFEIIYVNRGCVNRWIDNQGMWDVTAGRILVTRPGELHGSVKSFTEPGEVYYFLLRFPPEEALPGLSLQATSVLEKKFLHMTPRIFPAPRTLVPIFERLLHEHENPSEHSTLIVRGGLYELLGLIIRAHENSIFLREQPSGVSWRIQLACTWMRDHLRERITLADIAAAAGMPTRQFRALFLAQVGTPPYRYLNQFKVQRAKALLRDGGKVTAVARQAGLGSSQHFAEAFKRNTGMTPSEYRAAARQPEKVG